MNDKPLVTVNILSFNRKDELRNTLTKVYEQDYKNIEVIVVDNSSSDGSAEMVKNEFPSVRLIQMEKNVGIAGWNEGFKVAKGEYVLVLDDDSYPDRNALLQVVNILLEKNKVGIVALNIFDKSRNIYETKDFSPPFKDFIGCGVLIRKSCIDEIGGFDNRFFIYAHETDFSIRLLNAGYLIDYCDEAIAYHRNLVAAGSKPAFSKYRFVYQSLSYVKLINKYLQPEQIKKYKRKLLLNRFLVALYFCMLKDFIKLLKLISKELPDNQRVFINQEIISLYNFNVEIFSRYYFNRLFQYQPRKYYPFLYLKTLFSPLARKKLLLE
ncbi:MAG: glycosyltransferase family 2 protein [Ignavibacterium sp.]|jgi:GT2 family glycosyltransferase|nr:glycosyltransferase family 2 protein [Ignavibacterium sp.]